MKKHLQPGDIGITSLGDTYMYLGYYMGRPVSNHRQPEMGYLYAQIFGKKIAMSDRTTIINNILPRIQHEIDANAAYTKQPKEFAGIINHVDIVQYEFTTSAQTIFGHPFGLTRIGSQKPTQAELNDQDIGQIFLMPNGLLSMYTGQYTDKNKNKGHLYLTMPQLGYHGMRLNTQPQYINTQSAHITLDIFQKQTMPSCYLFTKRNALIGKSIGSLNINHLTNGIKYHVANRKLTLT